MLEQGRVVERGTHETLLAREGAYAALWNRQRADEEALASPARAEAEPEATDTRDRDEDALRASEL